MDLEALKTRLAEQDARLDQVIRLNTMAVRELQLAKTKSSLRWLVPGIVVELIMTIMAVVWLGNFIAGHGWEPQFSVPAVLLDICVIALLGANVRQLMLIGGLNYSLPVVAVQKELGKLRVLRIRTTKWTFILSFVLWFPAFVVLLKGWLGVDLWLILGAISNQNEGFFRWLVGNVLFGLVVALIIMWVARRYADRMGRSPAIKSLMDDIAGHSLTQAMHYLDEIVGFEAEPPGAHGVRSEK